MRVPSYKERVQRISDRKSWLKEFRHAQQVELQVKSWVKQQVPMPEKLHPSAYRSFPTLRRKLHEAQEVVRLLANDSHKLF